MFAKSSRSLGKITKKPENNLILNKNEKIVNSNYIKNKNIEANFKLNSNLQKTKSLTKIIAKKQVLKGNEIIKKNVNENFLNKNDRNSLQMTNLFNNILKTKPFTTENKENKNKIFFEKPSSKYSLIKKTDVFSTTVKQET